MNNLFKYIIGGSLAVGSLALIISAPKTAGNLKPLENDRMQESTEFGVFTDKETGNIYSWIPGPGGEDRFVKMDKNSENKVRQERIKEQEQIAREQAKAAGEFVETLDKNDVRSGEIFAVDEFWEGFEVNSRIKYRARERQMLYRLSIKAVPITTSNDATVKCISADRQDELLSLVTNEKNEVRLRFKDSDDFWIKDFLIPLGKRRAENFVTTAIDAYYKDSCNNTNQFVFHGRLRDFSLPDYAWVEEGKLLFSGVKISKPEDELKGN